MYEKYSMEKVFRTPDDFADDPSFRAFVRNTDPEAVRHWTDWLARHPDRLPDAEEAIRLVDALDQYVPRRLTGQQLEQEIHTLQQRLVRETQQPLTGPTADETPGRVSSRRWLHRVVRVAAAVVVLFFTGYFLYWLNRSVSPSVRVESAMSDASPIRAAPEPNRTTGNRQLTRTDYGQRRTIRLPDGSVVTLNAHSTLTLSPDWVDGKREVVLTGEAFFRVSKQQRAGNPVKFTVRAGNVVVEVLGTQFDVSTRNRRVKVVLNEGRIRLSVPDDARTTPDDSRTLEMLPGDIVEVSDKKTITLNSQAEVAEHSAWVMGELVFDDAPLSEVADVIRENYGYAVEFADPALAGQRLTATLPDQNLDVLLKALEKAFSLSITRHQNIIRIARPGSPLPNKS